MSYFHVQYPSQLWNWAHLRGKWGEKRGPIGSILALCRLPTWVHMCSWPKCHLCIWAQTLQSVYMGPRWNTWTILYRGPFFKPFLSQVAFTAISTGAELTKLINRPAVCNDSYRRVQEPPFKTTKMTAELPRFLQNRSHSPVVRLHCIPFWISLVAIRLIVALSSSHALFLWLVVCLSNGIQRQFLPHPLVLFPGNQSWIQRNQTNSLFRMGKERECLAGLISGGPTYKCSLRYDCIQPTFFCLGKENHPEEIICSALTRRNNSSLFRMSQINKY